MSNVEKYELNDDILSDVAGGCMEGRGENQDGRDIQVSIWMLVPGAGRSTRIPARCKCGASGDMYAKSFDENTGTYYDVKCYTCDQLYPKLTVDQLMTNADYHL